jgi:hypothetical protein
MIRCADCYYCKVWPKELQDYHHCYGECLLHKLSVHKNDECNLFQKKGANNEQ